ncbi:MAG: CvpA family protein [Burkholderiaceae bacterium]|jgi:membrane protein required for colicin V production|nr:CvpA family protein [Burkholderiaceae bacterium]
MAMTTLDWIIVAGVSLSVLLGLWRGFVREVLSLVGWIAGLWLALLYAGDLGARLPFDLPWPAARTALAALAIVLACVILAALVAWAIGKFLSAVKLSGTDRMLGALFGLLRAALVVLLAVLFIGRTELVQHPVWRESLLLPHLQAAVRFAAPLLSPEPAPASRA